MELGSVIQDSSGTAYSKRTFAGKPADPCPHCGRADRQDPTSKGGWANKLVAVIVAHERGDVDMRDALLEKCLAFEYFVAHAL